jgi:peptidoglycan/LPS O-acetylase OafA/YrhL
VRERSLRLTWAWLWVALALALLVAGAVIIAAIALSGSDRDEVLLAVALIGFPALLGVFALGTLAVVMARPSGSWWRALRRWVLALVGSATLLTGLATVRESGQGAILLIVAGACALAFVALDVRRGRGGE